MHRPNMLLMICGVGGMGVRYLQLSFVCLGFERLSELDFQIGEVFLIVKNSCHESARYV